MQHLHHFSVPGCLRGWPFLDERNRFGIVDPTFLDGLTDENGNSCVDSSENPIAAPCTTLAPYDLTWLEEPVSPDDVAGHVRVVREGGLPVAAGENLHTLWEFRQLIAAGGVTYPEPDVTNCGGVMVFMKIAHLAEAFNLPVTSHGAHDLTVHLLAAAPNRSYLEAHGFGLDRFIAAPLVIDDGLALAPDRPGHGIEFDWKALDGVRAPA